MKIGLVSGTLASIGLQEKMLKEGHEVSVWVAVYAPITHDASGLAEKYPGQYTCGNLGSNFKFREWDPFPVVKKALDVWAANLDFIVFDFNNKYMLPIANYLRTIHPHVVGPSELTNALEEDRALGKLFAQMHGFAREVPSQWVSSKEEAFKLMDEYPEANWVLKGMYRTVMPLKMEDCRDIIEHDMQDILDDAGGFFMERRIVGGEEWSYDVWFNGEDYYPYCLINREYKGAQNNLRGGVFTGESGTVAQFHPLDDMPTFVQEFWVSVKQSLITSGYRGFVGINTISYRDTPKDEWKLHFLEFTTRMGYPTEHYVSTALNYSAFYAWLSGFTASKKPPKPKTEPTVALAYLNYSKSTEETTYWPLVHGLDKLSKNVHYTLFDSHYEGEGKVRVHENDRAVILNAFGKTVEEARDKLYKEAHKVEIWSHTYRDDVGEDLIEVPDIPFFIHGLLRDAYDPLTIQAHGNDIEDREMTEELAKQIMLMEYSVTGNYDDIYDEMDQYEPNSRVLTQSINGILVSALVYHLIPDGDANFERGWFIENIVTLKAFNGQGMASELIDKLGTKKVDKRKPTITLVCYPELVQWYEKQGFSKGKFFKRDGKWVMAR